MATLLRTWIGCSLNEVGNKISAHNTDSNAHVQIQRSLDNLQQDFLEFKLQFGKVTQNAFSITFENLDDIDASQIGIWNVEMRRIEF